MAERESAGLTREDVERRRKTFGLNLLPRQRHIPLWRRLLAQLVHFFAVMLWIASGLAILAGMPQLGLANFVVIELTMSRCSRLETVFQPICA